MKTTIKIFAAVLAALMPVSTLASLSAVVTPGYQYPLDGSVALSYGTLNLLATPTITIYGTVGGSNTLSLGSVTAGELASGITDGTTLVGGDGVTLAVAAQGISTNNLNTNDWQWPLSQTTLASPLRLNYNPILFSTPTNLLGSGTNLGPLSLNYDTAAGLTTNASGLTIQKEPPGQMNTALIVQGVLFAGTVTNYYTNFSTVLVGGTNGTGTLAILGTGYQYTTTNVIIMGVNGGVTNYVTNAVPLLAVAGGGGSLTPLTIGLAPWTNSWTKPTGDQIFYFTNVFNLGYFGGLLPYTNSLTYAVTSIQGAASFAGCTLTNPAPTLSGFTAITAMEVDNGSHGSGFTLTISDVMTDASQQIATKSASITFFYP